MNGREKSETEGKGREKKNATTFRIAFICLFVACFTVNILSKLVDSNTKTTFMISLSSHLVQMSFESADLYKSA